MKLSNYWLQRRDKPRQAEREWRDLGDKQANELFLKQPQLRNAQGQLQAAGSAIAAGKTKPLKKLS